MSASADPPLMAAGANRPLAGIVVLDLGQVYQGPYATLLMAKAGADVIKIEPPQGEPLRRRAPPGKSTTFPIAMLNSNKRAITLNLKHERGRALLFRMVERGDVLLENFAPGVMDRLGVGWEACRSRCCSARARSAPPPPRRRNSPAAQCSCHESRRQARH